MNRKLVIDYIVYTFLIVLLSWGLCDIICLIKNVSLDQILLLRIPYFIGGFSPTISSYLVLKKHNHVNGIKEWLKKIFIFKDTKKSYIFVLAFVFMYYLIGCTLSNFTYGAPFFIALVTVPLMILGGGNEEVGWRMILEPELEKKYGFILSCFITGIIWWIWHGPLFLINGTESVFEYLYFGLNCMGLSYLLSIVKKQSNGIFPCIVFHCLINGLSPIFLFDYSLLSSLVFLIVSIIVSIIINSNLKG